MLVDRFRLSYRGESLSSNGSVSAAEFTRKLLPFSLHGRRCKLSPVRKDDAGGCQQQCKTTRCQRSEGRPSDTWCSSRFSLISFHRAPYPLYRVVEKAGSNRPPLPFFLRLLFGGLGKRTFNCASRVQRYGLLASLKCSGMVVHHMAYLTASPYQNS